MSKFRTLNPSNKNRTLETIRFRGLLLAENEPSVPNDFISASDNLESFKLREMTVREGTSNRVTYPHGVNSGQKTINQIVVGSGPDLYVDPIRDTLTPTEDIDFIRPITIAVFELDKNISTWRVDQDGADIRITFPDTNGFNFTVDWGDGATESHAAIAGGGSLDLIHPYAHAGSYIVKISKSAPRILLQNRANSSLIAITNMGSVNSVRFACDGHPELASVKFGSSNMSKCSSISFASCPQMRSIDFTGATFPLVDIEALCAHALNLTSFKAPNGFKTNFALAMLFDCPRLTVVDFTPWDFTQLEVLGGFIFALKDTPLDIPSYDSLLLRLDEAGISGAYPIDANLCFCTDGLLNVNRVSLVGKGFIIDDGHTP